MRNLGSVPEFQKLHDVMKSNTMSEPADLLDEANLRQISKGLASLFPRSSNGVAGLPHKYARSNKVVPEQRLI